MEGRRGDEKRCLRLLDSYMGLKLERKTQTGHIDLVVIGTYTEVFLQVFWPFLLSLLFFFLGFPSSKHPSHVCWYLSASLRVEYRQEGLKDTN